MLVLEYTPQRHQEIIRAAVEALRDGKTVVYPTDTSYGLACDPDNAKAVKKFYAIKHRSFKQPVHVIIPSIAAGKRLVSWNSTATKLVQSFWPGALSIVLPLRSGAAFAKRFSAGTGTLGLRMPKHKIPLDLAKLFGKPIPATSANPSSKVFGGFDSYSADDVIKQFSALPHKPDIIINAGRLPRRKPSTMVLVEDDMVSILRDGPISLKQIAAVLQR